MAGHQAIRPDLRARFPRRFGQQLAIETINIVAEECRLATIATLADVMRNTRNHKASDTGHAGIMTVAG